MLRRSASLTASAAKAELNVMLLLDMLTRALYARQHHGIHSCRKQFGTLSQVPPSRNWTQAGGQWTCTHWSPAPFTAHCYANHPHPVTMLVWPASKHGCCCSWSQLPHFGELQEVRVLDLLNVNQRTELRFPPTPSDCIPGERCVGGCRRRCFADGVPDPRDPRALGVALDRVTPSRPPLDI